MLARLAAERRRRESEARATELSDALHDVLTPLARHSTRRILPRPEVLTVAAYLVPHEKIDAFRRSVHRLSSNHPTLRLLCTGPWPPYHFAPPLNPAEAAHA
jgi:hypothetical protein